MEHNMLLAKEAVLNKYSINHPYYAFFVCSLYGLLQKYKGYEDIILKTFATTTIIIEEGMIKSIAERHGIKITNLDAEGICFINDCPSFGKNGEVIKTPGNNFIICKKSNDMSLLLNIFCHEYGHLIKSYNMKYKIEKAPTKTTIIGRTGLAIISSSYDFEEKKESDTLYKNVIFDEAINTLQTTEVMEEIVLLKEFVSDPEIQDFLSSLNDYFLIHDYGYHNPTKLIKKLWNIDSFKRLIESHIIEGDIYTIYKIVSERIDGHFLDCLSKILESEYNDKSKDSASRKKRKYYMDEFAKIWEKRFKEYVYSYSSFTED